MATIVKQGYSLKQRRNNSRIRIHNRAVKHEINKTIKRYTVRNARVDDVDRLVEMQLSLQQHMAKRNVHIWKIDPAYIDRIRDYYHTRMIDENSVIIVIEDTITDYVIGTGLGRIIYHDGYIPNKSGEINDIWIEPEHRKQGLCRKAVSRILDFFESFEIEHLLLKYADNNMEAENVWKRYGFRKSIVTCTSDIQDVRERLSRDQKF